MMKPLVFCLAASLLAAMSAPGFAGGRDNDRVHADSFGNLVIYSSAGYKRIVVGAGKAAPRHAANRSHREAGIPRVAHHEGQRLYLSRASDCEFGAVLVHGRSYMYGLPEGVVPTPADVLCR